MRTDFSRFDCIPDADTKSANSHIIELLIAMDHWANDEDGIHPDAFPAYEAARAFVGQPVPESDENGDGTYFATKRPT